jgi:hypothetical protein
MGDTVPCRDLLAVSHPMMLPRTHATLTNPIVVAGSAVAFATIYALMGREPSGLTALYIQFAPCWSLVCWTVADLRSTRLATIYDWGFFHLLAWPVLIPWYLKHRYGRGAWPLIGLFTALLVAPILATALGVAMHPR